MKNELVRVQNTTFFDDKPIVKTVEETKNSNTILIF